MNSEIQEHLQKYIDKMQAKGITPTMEQLNEHIAGYMNDLNNRSRENFEGYSPIEMMKILDFTFNDDSPVQFNTLTSEEYNQMPLFRQAKHLLQTLVKKEEKLTAAGYLPPRIVKELYPMGVGSRYIESGLYKLTKEVDADSVVLTRIILDIAGLSKVRKGVMSATAAGAKVANDDAKLFMILFKAFCQKFNWGYFDGYEEKQTGRYGFGFSLILLNKYGSQKQDDFFYAHKYFKAFPMMAGDDDYTNEVINRYCHCYSLRTFERFLLHFSLVEIQEEGFIAPKHITKTALFDKFIKILPHRKF